MESKTAAKLRAAAESAQKEVDRLRATRSTNTRKRQNEWETAMSRARPLELIADKLTAIADAYEAIALPGPLFKIDWKYFSHSHLETILNLEALPPITPIMPMVRIGLGDPADYAAARAAIMAMGDPAAGTIRPAEAMKRLEIEVDNSRIPGYFPTPPELALRLVSYVTIRPQAKILEPSAGKGSIADVIRENYPDAQIDVCEWSHSLNEILRLKGYNVVGNDVFELPQTRSYDVILLNPPFEQGADMKHVRFCFEHLLAEGGELGAIMSEGPFFRSDKASVEFRDWFKANGGAFVEKNQGAFKNADRATGVATCIVHMGKEEAAVQVESPPLSRSIYHKDFKVGDSVLTRTRRPAIVVKVNGGLVQCKDSLGQREHKAETLMYPPTVGIAAAGPQFEVSESVPMTLEERLAIPGYTGLLAVGCSYCGRTMTEFAENTEQVYICGECAETPLALVEEVLRIDDREQVLREVSAAIKPPLPENHPVRLIEQMIQKEKEIVASVEKIQALLAESPAFQEIEVGDRVKVACLSGNEGTVKDVRSGLYDVLMDGRTFIQTNRSQLMLARKAADYQRDEAEIQNAMQEADTPPLHDPEADDDQLADMLLLEDYVQGMPERQRRILLSVHYGNSVDRNDMATAWTMQNSGLLNVIDRAHGKADLTDFGRDVAAFMTKNTPEPRVRVVKPVEPLPDAPVRTKQLTMF